jgi:hypothetical protein
MTRSTHLVGSWTSRSPAMAMDNALERLAPHLQRHGETGYLRSKWVQPTLEALRANPEGLSLARSTSRPLVAWRAGRTSRRCGTRSTRRSS